jgi:hypothetical protein
MATRERTEERVERTETPSDYKPRLKEQYNNELRAQLKDELDISMMKVPRLQKITLNMASARRRTTRSSSTRPPRS